MEDYPCPACGFIVFSTPIGSYDICPICGWEDDGVQLANPTSGGGANRQSLVEVQEEALRTYPREVLEAKGFERDPSWRPVSTQEAAEHRAVVASKGHWPNRACSDGQYYWRGPGREGRVP